MSGSHQLHLYSPTGEFVTDLRSWKSIDCVLSENEISPLTVALSPEYSDQIFRRHCRIAYERAPLQYGIYSQPKLIGGTTWLLTHRERIVDENGQSTILLRCEHPNTILKARVVAYNEKSTQAEHADTASDVLYDVVNQNLVAATDTARNLSSSHFVLDPRPAPVFGASITKSISYRNVLTILQELVKASAQQGAYCGFEVWTPVAPGPFHYRIYSKYRGTDRSRSSNQPLIFYSLFSRSGGIGQGRAWEDWSDTVSFVYAGGAGKKDERSVQTASDADLINQSPFGRVEFFRSVNSDDTNSILNEAERTLRSFRPRREFESDFGNQSDFVYDLHYTWGDIVSVQFLSPTISFGQVTSWTEYFFDVRLNPVHITAQRFFDKDGVIVDEQETLEIHLRSLTSTT